MPIINRKNNNKHNVVTNVTPATSAKASVTVNFPWNVLQTEPYSSQGYLTTVPTPFLGIQDINLNKVNIIIDPTLSENSQGYVELIDGVNFIKIGTLGIDLTNSSNHDSFLQYFVTVFNNVKSQLSFKLSASLLVNTNTLVFEHSNSSLGTSSNNHQIITGFDESITLQYLLILHTNMSVNNTYVLGTDEIFNTTFDYLNKEQKSGSVTLSPKNKIRTLKRTLFPKKKKHSKFAREKLNIFFDDNKTINFLNESINSNTRLSQNNDLNSLIISSPNTFDLSFSNQEKTNKQEFVDYYLQDFQKENKLSDSFNEFTCFYENKEEGSFSEEEIEINLNFSIPAILSNNRTLSPSDDEVISDIRYEESQSLVFPVSVNNSTIQESIKTKRHSSPTAYYNFEENRWDYLGNIKRPSYLEMSTTFPSYEISDPNAVSREGFDKEVDSYDAFTEITDTDEKIISFLKNNNICFSGVTNDYALNLFRSESSGFESPQFFDIVNKHTGSVGSPIGNFGFPFSEKYEPLNDHIINLKEHIHKDFSLKKVVFDGEFSCYLPGKSALEVGETIGVDQIIAGSNYRILSVGDTDFSTIGGPVNASPGNTFEASGAGTGTGTVEEISYGGRRIGINNISFFLVNNRKNLNESYFDNIESQQSNCLSWDESSLNDQNEYDRLSIKSFPESEDTRFGLVDETGVIRKFSYFNSDDSIVGQETENGVLVNNLIFGAHIQSGATTAFSKPSQRDLITYNNIVNFCSGSLDESSKYFCLDYNKIKNESDVLVELSPYHNNSFDAVENELDNSSSYFKRNIQIVSKVKAGTKQNDFSIYSYFPTLLSNKHGKRTMYEYNSGRSEKETYTAEENDFYTSTFTINPAMSSLDQENNLVIETKSFNNSFIEDEYILKPEDTLFLGVSLTNSFNNYRSLNGNLGDDVFIIHSLKIKLIGSYKQNEKNKSSYGYLNNNSNIKHSVIGDNDLFDELESTPYQLLSNYYTRKYDKHGIDSSYTNNGQKINTTGIFFSSFNTNESIYDTRMNNILDVIEVDNKKIIDSDWPEMGNYSGSNNLSGYLITVPQNYADPTDYDNNIRVASYPYEEKYSTLEKPLNVDYKSIGLKGIADTLGTQTVGVLPKIFPNNPLFYNFNNNANNYFYSFNKKNPNNTRMPIAFKTSGVDPDWMWFNNKYDFEIDGFRYGVLNPNSSYNTISYSNKKYGNFSDKINRNLNYATISEEGDVSYTVLKNFFIDYVPVQDISTLSNTYNKDKYSRFAIPFIDRSAADLV